MLNNERKLRFLIANSEICSDIQNLWDLNVLLDIDGHPFDLLRVIFLHIQIVDAAKLMICNDRLGKIPIDGYGNVERVRIF